MFVLKGTVLGYYHGNPPPPSPNPPNPPSNLTAAALSPTSVRLNWSDNSTNEDSFAIQRKTGSGNFTQIKVLGANTRSYTNTGLAPATNYSYRVKAVNSGGSSGYSNQATVATLTEPPEAPSALLASALSSSSVQLNWMDNSLNEESFVVQRKTGSGNFAQIEVLGANTRSYTNSGLQAATSYTYRVNARNIGGSSAFSNNATVTTDGVSPAPPGNLIAVVTTSTAIDVTWSDLSDDETNFVIERSVAGGSFEEIVTLGANVTNYTDNTLEPGTSYSYRVKATNSWGASGFSNASPATTLTAIDSWKVAEFGANADNSNIAGPGADPDNDGLSNLQEYCFGSNPLVSNSGAVTPIGTTNDQGVSYPSVSFRVNKAAIDVRAIVRVTTDLTDPEGWNSGPDVTTEVSRVDEGDSERITVRSNVSLDEASHQFLDIMVVQI